MIARRFFLAYPVVFMTSAGRREDWPEEPKLIAGYWQYITPLTRM
jgi:hypothetical protein